MELDDVYSEGVRSRVGESSVLTDTVRETMKRVFLDTRHVAYRLGRHTVSTVVTNLEVSSVVIYSQGRTQAGGGGGERGPAPLWDLKNTIFSWFLPLNYVICIFEICFFSFLLYGRIAEGCSMVNSSRKVDFSHPTGHYRYMKKKFGPPPRENPGCAPVYSRPITISAIFPCRLVRN